MFAKVMAADCLNIAFRLRDDLKPLGPLEILRRIVSYSHVRYSVLLGVSGFY